MHTPDVNIQFLIWIKAIPSITKSIQMEPDQVDYTVAWGYACLTADSMDAFKICLARYTPKLD